MKTRISRIVAMLLALALVLSMPMVASAEEDVIVLTAASCRAGQGENYNDRLITQEIEKRLGIRLDVTDYAFEAWNTQLTLLMAEDKLPDLLIEEEMTRTDVNRYGQEGYFLDLSKYLDIMPNFKARLEADPVLDAYSRDESGAIYGISKTRDSQVSRYVARSFWNSAWLERLGLEEPTTTEELYNVLKAFKEQDANGNGDPNDEIPLSLTFDRDSGTRVEFVLRSAFGIYGYTSNLQMQVDKENKKVYLAETTENYKEYLKFMNRLYEEGLLDQEAFIQTEGEYVEKTKTDRLGLFGTWNNLASIMGRDNTVFHDYNFFTGVKSDLVDGIYYPLWNPVNANCIMVVSADCSNPEAACKLIDYFYSDEGVALSLSGIKDVTYREVPGKVVPENTSSDYTGFWEESGYATASEWVAKKVLYVNAFKFLQYSKAYRWIDNATDEQLIQAHEIDPTYCALEITMEKNMRKVNVIDDYPLMPYMNDEAETRAYLMTDLQTYIQTMKAQFITGEADIDAQWDTFVKTMNTMCLEDLLKIEQAAYDRYSANN